MSFVTVNPINGDIIQVHHYQHFEDAKLSLQSMSIEQKKWANRSIYERAEQLKKISKLLLDSSYELASQMSLETGKIISEAQAEIEKSAFAFDFFSKNYLAEFEKKMIPTNYQFSYTQLNSLGVVFAIMPWNYPVWQLTRVLAPALLLGNAVLVKPAEITVGTNQMLISLLDQVLSEKVVQQLMIDHETIAQIISQREISAVTLTGSSVAGKKVAKICGEHLKKCVLELGGSDAYIVMEDADLELSVRECIQARLVNYGQSCIAGKRFFISQNNFTKFKDQILERLSVLPDRVLAHKKFQSQIQDQVEKLIHVGGRVLKGGVLPSGAGAQYPITLIEFDRYHSSIAQEEIFGPVFCLIPFEQEDQVFSMVNDCPFGLGAVIFTQRVGEAQKWAKEKLEVGMVGINEQIKSDPRLPFGGVKDSGFGRELSHFGLYEFANIQTVIGREK